MENTVYMAKEIANLVRMRGMIRAAHLSENVGIYRPWEIL